MDGTDGVQSHDPFFGIDTGAGAVSAADETTVTVELVASLTERFAECRRALHVVPTVDGAVNVIVAVVDPVLGNTLLLFRYRQSIYEKSALLAGQ